MNFQQFLTSKNITQEQFDAMKEAEQAKLFAQFAESVAEVAGEAKKASEENKTALEDTIDKEAMDGAIKDYFEEQFKDQYSPEDIKKKIDSMQDKVAALTDKGGANDDGLGLEGSIKSVLLKQKEDIAALKDNQNANVKINLTSVVNKAVADMTFATHVTGRVGRQEREAGIVNILRRKPRLLDILNVSPTRARTYSWVQKTGVEGGVTMVAEGAVKPQGDFDLAESTQTPKKTALVITVSKEMLEDIDDMAKTIADEIRELITLFVEENVLTADGTGNNITGIDANATTFAAGTFADTIDDANIFDVIRVAYNQVNLNHDEPTHVLMHPSDATSMELKKDSQNRYVMPPFVGADGTTVKGLPVIATTIVTQDELYVGNFSRYKVKLREGLELQMGYRGANDDWVKNLVSFLGEMRLFGFIPSNHYGSIVKADITTAKAALETP